MTPTVLLLAVHAAAAQVSVPARPVESSVVAAALDRLAATDVDGTQDEARRALANGAQGPFSPKLSLQLTHIRRYLDLAQNPSPTPDELRAAFLSDDGVAAARAVFDRMIDDAIVIDGRRLVPEVGGEATLDSALRLRDIPDFARPVLRALAAERSDPAALRSLYAAHPEEMKTIDESGVLKGALGVVDRLKARGDPPEKIAALLALATRTILENSASSWTLEPAAQLRSVCAQDWSGRYVGRWHTHPPHDGPAGWGGGDVPSGPDMQNAVDDGQFLTVAFQPDGFIVYDASALGEAKTAGLNLMKKIVYRSEAWRRHFQERWDASQSAASASR